MTWGRLGQVVTYQSISCCKKKLFLWKKLDCGAAGTVQTLFEWVLWFHVSILSASIFGCQQGDILHVTEWGMVCRFCLLPGGVSRLLSTLGPCHLRLVTQEMRHSVWCLGMLAEIQTRTSNSCQGRSPMQHLCASHLCLKLRFSRFGCFIVWK